MTDPRAIIFDFDGVIADSEPVHERALLETVAEAGLTFSHEQYLGEIIGYDDRDAYPAIFRMNGRAFDPSQADELIARKEALVHRLIAEGEVRPLPGTLELARAAQDRAVRIGICSGAMRAEIDLMLGVFGAPDLFGVIVAADDVPKAKPDPAGYLLAATKLGVEPSLCSCIEDTPHGIAAAKAAGLGRVLGVCHSLPASELSQADAVFADSTQITLDQLLVEPE